ncbi:type I methionyl aminopeptidase [Hoeflea sp. YIM 152468]|uniref:type I methionyl aminopeptidase n=1 Tax=Hoeflea sp. YIM 152468 TaxID=3031759 RepID=UPI0023DB4072|nr:type I methionyl aminopeptidase [Hoeflea sp. YIM 152468]MDF1607952.1 type I methionyl aminopeptidase [Hoeflea sp. YIM 152468]
MMVSSESDLEKLRQIGRICANAIRVMAGAMEAGMTTRELDRIGRQYLEANGAQSAPETCYQFPGATCISINEEVAHGVPGDRVIAPGDLVNIDVSALKDGFFGDTGASFGVAPVAQKTARLLRDGKRALSAGLTQVRSGARYASIGDAVGRFAGKNGYTLIRNLASHGVGLSLHEEPAEIATWPNRSDRRVMAEGQVFTIERFLSLGAVLAEDADEDDGGGNWTLYSCPRALTVQFEHTVVASRNGPIILTLPDNIA